MATRQRANKSAQAQVIELDAPLPAKPQNLCGTGLLSSMLHNHHELAAQQAKQEKEDHAFKLVKPVLGQYMELRCPCGLQDCWRMYGNPANKNREVCGGSCD